MSIDGYLLQPLSTNDATHLRQAGGITVIADESPGFPCRACLRDADVGDEMLLTSYDPFETDSPYRSPSPIYVHAQACTPAVVEGDLPDSLTRRKLSVRAFDTRAGMITAEVIDGSDLDMTARTMLADPTVERLHVHNAAPGCWAVTIVRA